MSNRKRPEVPDILKMGRRGSNIKVWTFLRLNENQWYTSKEISGYLELPLSTVQLALRRLVMITSRIQSREIEVIQRGRLKKQYCFQLGNKEI